MSKIFRPASPASHPLQNVLLRHDLPDGSHHFDWLVERVAGEPRLFTLRVPSRFDGDQEVEVMAQRLDDHRRLYLSFEGEISGGRGRVTRVAEGLLKWGSQAPDRYEWIGSLGTFHGVIATHQIGGTSQTDPPAMWRIHVLPDS